MPGQIEFDKIFVSFRNALIRSVSHIVPPKDIEDIVQETYVRVCQVDKKEAIKYPRSFMLKTAKNLALDHVKRADFRLNQSIDEETLENALPADELHDETYTNATTNEEFAQFCEAVRHLPAQCRRAFILKKVYGYTQKEIAEYMDISESTVEKHIANGIKRCTYYMNQNSMQDQTYKNTADVGKQGDNS
jgi:RNA polymerase sigma factor (sigma-70 family)